MNHTIRLHSDDNIVVLARSVKEGEVIGIDGADHPVRASLGLGHKVASRRIAAGEIILKYGVPIGSATSVIEPGDHVHLHNMKSDYLPTYTLEEGRAFRTTP